MILNHVKSILILLIVVLVSTFNLSAQPTLAEKQIIIKLRKIGHDILLASNDSTSVVLPIEKIEGRYRIQFESEFEFIPSKLTSIIHQNLENNKVFNQYIVEIENCIKKEIIYSYEMSLVSVLSEVTCQSRQQPVGCYVIYVSFLNPNPILITSVRYKDSLKKFN